MDAINRLPVGVAERSSTARKNAGGDESVDRMDQRVDCIELYRESPTWQGLAVTSRSSTSLPVVGSDSWVRPSNVGNGRIFMCRGI